MPKNAHVQSVPNYCFSLLNTQICDVLSCRRRGYVSCLTAEDMNLRIPELAHNLVIMFKCFVMYCLIFVRLFGSLQRASELVGRWRETFAWSLHFMSRREIWKGHFSTMSSAWGQL